MSWEGGRKEHIQLSNAAATHYDELYADSNFATGSYMNYEVQIIEKWAACAPDQHLAVDLGCGTGRDSFVLAKRFDQVYAYDFSEKMIAVATQNKINRDVGNVLFAVRDVERELLDLQPGTASFVNSSFGMGSFVENVEIFFRQVKQILKPQGIAIFSFYNATALVNRLRLDWRPALTARSAPDRDALLVDFSGREYEIAARSYGLREIRLKLEGNFEILSLTTFPTLSALFPQELFEDSLARDLCTNVDNLLADNLALAAGPYIVAVVRRAGKKLRQREVRGYERVLSLLARHNVIPDFRHHAPVRNMEDVKAVIDAPLDEMIKSIIVSVNDDPSRGDGHPRLYLFGVPADRKLDFGKVSSYLGKPRKHVRAATQTEVEDLTGFTIGSIPPFGMPRDVVVVIDSRLAGKRVVWCGTGIPTQSLRLSVDDLRKLSTFSVGDISKPGNPL